MTLLNARVAAFVDPVAAQEAEEAEAKALRLARAVEEAATLPGWFYDERPELAHIRTAAHARSVSADAVLADVLARVAVLTPPRVLLPAVVGQAGTLDLFVSKVGHSGAGKSAAAGTAADLVPITRTDIAELPLGSGEGVIEAYFAWVKEEDRDGKPTRVKRQVFEGILFHLDEGQVLAETGKKRSGSTLLPTIRSGWSGQALGQANAGEETKRILPARRYRFVLSAGFQTETAMALVDDAAGGTPQRSLFLSAEDPSIPDEAPPWPGPLYERPSTYRLGELGIDPEVAQEVRRRRLARSRGEEIIDPLDAHRDLNRLKVAGVLSVMADRHHIDADDWRLAGVILDASDRKRASIIEAAHQRARQAEETSTRRAIRREAALEQDKAGRARESAARSIAKRIQKGHCADGCSRSCATTAMAGKHRQIVSVDDALDVAHGKGWIAINGPTITPGEVPCE